MKTSEKIAKMSSKMRRNMHLTIFFFASSAPWVIIIINVEYIYTVCVYKCVHNFCYCFIRYMFVRCAKEQFFSRSKIQEGKK